MELSFEDLRIANLIRHSEDNGGGSENTWHLTEWTNALCGEAGELANLAKKVRRNRPNDPTLNEARRELAFELADIVCYADLIASKLGVKLADAVKEKFNIVSDRVKSNVKL